MLSLSGNSLRACTASPNSEGFTAEEIFKGLRDACGTLMDPWSPGPFNGAPVSFSEWVKISTLQDKFIIYQQFIRFSAYEATLQIVEVCPTSCRPARICATL